MLAAGATEGVGFAVDAGVALLYTAIVAAAHQFARAREDCGANGNAALSQAQAGLVKGDGKHFLVEFLHRTTVTQRG